MILTAIFAFHNFNELCWCYPVPGQFIYSDFTHLTLHQVSPPCFILRQQDCTSAPIFLLRQQSVISAITSSEIERSKFFPTVSPSTCLNMLPGTDIDTTPRFYPSVQKNLAFRRRTSPVLASVFSRQPTQMRSGIYDGHRQLKPPQEPVRAANRQSLLYVSSPPH